MTNLDYGSARANMIVGIDKFTHNEYLKTLIPENVVKTLDLIVSFVGASQSIIFRDGKLMSLSLFNIFAWWKFLKLSYELVKNLIEVWK